MEEGTPLAEPAQEGIPAGVVARAEVAGAVGTAAQVAVVPAVVVVAVEAVAQAAVVHILPGVEVDSLSAHRSPWIVSWSGHPPRTTDKPLRHRRT